MVLRQGAQTAVATPLSRAGRGGNSVARASAARHSGRVRSAGSSRRHVLGEERGDVDARQYAALPAGQPAAGSGVVARSVESAAHGSCPGRPLRARDPLSRGPPTRRIGRVARHRLAKPWSGETPRTFDPCILRRRNSGRRSREPPVEPGPYGAVTPYGTGTRVGRRTRLASDPARTGDLGRRRDCLRGETERPAGLGSRAAETIAEAKYAETTAGGPRGPLSPAVAPAPPRSRRRRSTSSPRRRPPSGTRGRWPWPPRGRTR